MALVNSRHFDAELLNQDVSFRTDGNQATRTDAESGIYDTSELVLFPNGFRRWP